jgi:predicted  nucleic acid-binding Zn-ribbon protein
MPSSRDRLSAIEKRLVEVHKIVEVCRKDLVGAWDELAPNHTAYERAYWALKESYDQLYAQHNKALKDLAAMGHNNWTLKNEVQAAQSRATSHEERIMQLEKENAGMKNALGDTADLSLHLEQSHTGTTESEAGKVAGGPARKARRGAKRSGFDS